MRLKALNNKDGLRKLGNLLRIKAYAKLFQTQLSVFIVIPNSTSVVYEIMQVPVLTGGSVLMARTANSIHALTICGPILLTDRQESTILLSPIV